MKLLSIIKYIKDIDWNAFWSVRKNAMKQYYIENRWKYKVLLPCALLVFIIGNVWVIGIDVFQEEWDKFGSPYDYQSQYVKTKYCTIARIKLLEWHFSDDNFIANFLKNKQKQYYEESKHIIPADDLALDLME